MLFFFFWGGGGGELAIGMQYGVNWCDWMATDWWVTAYRLRLLSLIAFPDVDMVGQIWWQQTPAFWPQQCTVSLRMERLSHGEILYVQPFSCIDSYIYTLQRLPPLCSLTPRRYVCTQLVLNWTCFLGLVSELWWKSWRLREPSTAVSFRTPSKLCKSCWTSDTSCEQTWSSPTSKSAWRQHVEGGVSSSV